MARKFSGDATPEELAELQLLLLQNPGDNYSMEILNDLWHYKPELNRQYSENKYKELILRMQRMGIDEGRFSSNAEEILSRENNPGIKKSKKWVFTIAAVLITGLTVFLLIPKSESNDHNRQTQQSLAKHEIKTNYGAKTSMVLPDGTKVWLNAGSKMTYGKEYGVDLREVNLSGEAYFDVVKNVERPFIIHAGKIKIKVLGTAFNVRCYPDEKNTETSLVRGSLEITMDGSPEKYILKPSEKLIVSNNMVSAKENDRAGKTTFDQQKNEIVLGHLSILPQDSSIVETSWVNNKLVFDDERFADLAVKMERWYDLKINIEDEKLKNYKISGSFVHETTEEALKALQFLIPFNYTIKNNVINIIKK